MNIPWKLKSAIFRAIDRFGATGLLYWLQSNVTRRSRVQIGDGSPNWQTHREQLATLDRPSVFEFGAGKSLQQNLYLSSYFGPQTVVDLFPMIDLRLADSAARQISTLRDGRPYQPIARLYDLQCYGIEYHAPCDAGNTGYALGSFDACISTNTLEHIPALDIERILAELRRILRRAGLISAVIDYSDHYAHTDASIGRLNFLQFSDKEFEKHNHGVHYQNRLRHDDYLALFRGAGFGVLRAQPMHHLPPPPTVAPRFDTANPNTFATVGIFLLRNP